MEFTSDPRFTDAAERACDTVPYDLRTEMDRLATISEAEVEAAVAESRSWHDAMRSKVGPKARLSPPLSTTQARSSLELSRPDRLDWLFFRRWRLDGGWLTTEDAKRAMEIFHDPLAIAMRRAVVARLYPGVSFFTDDDPQPR